VKCNDFERRVWAGAHELEQSRPGRIGTSQLVLAIAITYVPVFHNGEDIAGVDRLAIGMVGMPDTVPTRCPRINCQLSRRACSVVARATAALFTTFIEAPQREGTEESSVPTPSVDLGTQIRSGADTAQ